MSRVRRDSESIISRRKGGLSLEKLRCSSLSLWRERKGDSEKASLHSLEKTRKKIFLGGGER